MILCGFCGSLVGFDALWFVVVTQAVIAILANYTAFYRILHVKNQL